MRRLVLGFALAALAGCGGGSDMLDGAAAPDMHAVSDDMTSLAPDLSVMPASCTDQTRDGNETGVDCGGSCPACPVGEACLHAGDCDGMLCINNVCTAASSMVDAGFVLRLATFAPAVPYGANQQPSYLAQGDLNHDGKLDLVAGNGGSNDVSALLGVGDGTFGAPSNTMTGGGPIGVADFTGDQQDDLIVSGTSAPNTNALLLFKGNGNGSFAAPVPYLSCYTNTGGSLCGTGGTIGNFVIGRLNADTRPDVAATITGHQGGDIFGPPLDQFSILLDLSNGTFQAMGPYNASVEAPSSPGVIGSGDFNGDTHLDLVVQENGGSGTSYMVLGNGDGTFQAPTAVSLQSTLGTTSALGSGDFNGDGKLDIVAADVVVNVLLGKGDGTFGVHKIIGVGGYALSLAVADFNGDGNLDIVTANFASGDISVLLGSGDGEFASFNFTAGKQPSAVVVGDYNGDGKPDIAVADRNVVNVLLNTTH